MFHSFSWQIPMMQLAVSHPVNVCRTNIIEDITLFIAEGRFFPRTL